jgi:hypothetical protein
MAKQAHASHGQGCADGNVNPQEATLPPVVCDTASSIVPFHVFLLVGQQGRDAVQQFGNPNEQGNGRKGDYKNSGKS